MRFYLLKFKRKDPSDGGSKQWFLLGVGDDLGGYVRESARRIANVLHLDPDGGHTDVYSCKNPPRTSLYD